MTTYAVLAVPFLVVAVAALLLARWRTGGPGLVTVATVLVVLLAMTAVFDNAIVGAGIVAYDEARILGVRLGVAPVEDFAYSVAAALALPALWRLLVGGRPARATGSADAAPGPAAAREVGR